MIVGNTIFGALLGERKVNLGIILQSVVAKLVEGAKKHKATSIGPYLLHGTRCATSRGDGGLEH